MLVIERGTPGMEIVRDVHTMDTLSREGDQHVGGHAEIHFNDAGSRSKTSSEGREGFLLAQKRLWPGRIPPRMRWSAVQPGLRR